MTTTTTISETPSEALSPVHELSEEDVAAFVKAQEQAHAELTEIPPLDIYSMGAWSSSKLKTLQKCQFQYYLKYVLKAKLPAHLQIQSDPLSANVGKAAHEILEHVVVGADVRATFDQVRGMYVGSNILTKEVWDERVEILFYNISNFKERVEEFARKNPIKKVKTELKIAINKDYQPVSFFDQSAWLRGVVDLVLWLECKDALIIDHKTGGGQGSVKMYAAQLDWYKVLFHFGIERVRGAQTGVHFIGEGEIKMADYTKASVIEGNLKNTLEMTLEGAIDTLISKGYFKHVRGYYCKWCEYDNAGCKSGAFKPLELSTKKWIQIHQDKSKVSPVAPSPTPAPAPQTSSPTGWTPPPLPIPIADDSLPF